MTTKYFKHDGMKVTHGAYVTCKIIGAEGKVHLIKDARVSINRNGNIYICQHEVAGANAIDKLGYPYSWYIGYIGLLDKMPADVKDFNLVSNDKDDYEVY